VAGGLCAPFLLLLCYFANVFSVHPHAISWSIGLHVASWIFQFIGHGVFEKRAPALLDSLSQALTLAPFFVWLEVSACFRSIFFFFSF
jgi:uncharacterized membrane protein YGL010W